MDTVSPLNTARCIAMPVTWQCHAMPWTAPLRNRRIHGSERRKDGKPERVPEKKTRKCNHACPVQGVRFTSVDRQPRANVIRSGNGRISLRRTRARLAMLVGLLALISSCSARASLNTPEPPMDLGSAKYALDSGKRVERRLGFLRQRGGDVISCAGSPVWLVPNTPFFRWVSDQPRATIGRNFARSEVTEYVRSATCESRALALLESPVRANGPPMPTGRALNT